MPYSITFSEEKNWKKSEKYKNTVKNIFKCVLCYVWYVNINCSCCICIRI